MNWIHFICSLIVLLNIPMDQNVADLDLEIDFDILVSAMESQSPPADLLDNFPIGLDLGHNPIEPTFSSQSPVSQNLYASITPSQSSTNHPESQRPNKKQRQSLGTSSYQRKVNENQALIKENVALKQENKKLSNDNAGMKKQLNK